MHYYQFNIGDYQSHTSHLSEMEDLAFRRMLDWCYLHEKPLPPEPDEIARLIRMRSHSDSIAIVLQEYFERNEEGWISLRVIAEILKVGIKSEKASASAKARWGKKDDANALQTQSERYATQDTLPITQDTKPIVEKAQRGSRLPTDFELPNNWIVFCNQERPDLQPHKVFDNFKDYWLSAPKGTKLDWSATWRNWVRSQKADKQNEMSKTGKINQIVQSGLTRGLIGGLHNVKLLGN
jgi:uncharacterized protein YdaU (DUF1376 family)